MKFNIIYREDTFCCWKNRWSRDGQFFILHLFIQYILLRQWQNNDWFLSKENDFSLFFLKVIDNRPEEDSKMLCYFIYHYSPILHHVSTSSEMIKYLLTTLYHIITIFKNKSKKISKSIILQYITFVWYTYIYPFFKSDWNVGI